MFALLSVMMLFLEGDTFRSALLGVSSPVMSLKVLRSGFLAGASGPWLVESTDSMLVKKLASYPHGRKAM